MAAAVHAGARIIGVIILRQELLTDGALQLRPGLRRLAAAAAAAASGGRKTVVNLLLLPREIIVILFF